EQRLERRRRDRPLRIEPGNGDGGDVGAEDPVEGTSVGGVAQPRHALGIQRRGTAPRRGEPEASSRDAVLPGRLADRGKPTELSGRTAGRKGGAAHAG